MHGIDTLLYQLALQKFGTSHGCTELRLFPHKTNDIVLSPRNTVLALEIDIRIDSGAAVIRSNADGVHTFMAIGSSGMRQDRRRPAAIRTVSRSEKNTAGLIHRLAVPLRVIFSDPTYKRNAQRALGL